MGLGWWHCTTSNGLTHKTCGAARSGTVMHRKTLASEGCRCHTERPEHGPEPLVNHSLFNHNTSECQSTNPRRRVNVIFPVFFHAMVSLSVSFQRHAQVSPPKSANKLVGCLSCSRAPYWLVRVPTGLPLLMGVSPRATREKTRKTKSTSPPILDVQRHI